MTSLRMIGMVMDWLTMSTDSQQISQGLLRLWLIGFNVLMIANYHVSIMSDIRCRVTQSSNSAIKPSPSAQCGLISMAMETMT